jgi:hypothetical protein
MAVNIPDQSNSPESLLEQAKALQRTSDMYREAARKLREAARLILAATEREVSHQLALECDPYPPDPRATSTTTTPPPMSAVQLPSDRLAQLNELLLELGPSQRYVIIEIAAQRGIPKNTTASYVTKDNFDYKDGFWYIKGTKVWPPKAYRLLADPGKFEVEGKDMKFEVGPSGED